MPWTSKSSNQGDNSYACADPATESSHRDNRHGHYYDGNERISAKEQLLKQGSQSLAEDQGHIRFSTIPDEEGGDETKESLSRLDKKKQGSHTHFDAGNNHKRNEVLDFRAI